MPSSKTGENMIVSITLSKEDLENLLFNDKILVTFDVPELKNARLARFSSEILVAVQYFQAGHEHPQFLFKMTL